MIRVFVPAPDLPPVRKRATGKLTQPNVWLNSNQRNHRMAEANLTAHWKSEAEMAFHGLPPMGKAHVRVFVWRARNGRYDPCNLYPTVKACVDGIVLAGVLSDDSYEHVLGPDMRHGGKGPVGLEFILEEIP